MILFKNALYLGKTVDLLVTENAEENAQHGFVFDEKDGFCGTYRNYGENYGKKGACPRPCGKHEPAGKLFRLRYGGKILFPSLIDVHVHFRDPGME